MLFLSRVGCFDFFALQMAEKDILYITLSNLKCQGDFLCDQVGCYSRKDMLRNPFGAMVSSADQTPQAPVMFLLIIHYFERPASSVRLVKAIHLRVRFTY